MATYLNYPFDPELFSYNWSQEKDLALENIVKSGAVVESADLKALIANGGDLFTLPFYKVIGGTPGNYDGATDVPVAVPEGGSQSGIVFGRLQGWKASDFVFDYNSGADPMKQITSQVAKFWNKQRQGILLNILDGIFGISDSEWDKHKFNIASNVVGTVTSDNKIGATTVGDAVVDALGDNGDVIALAFMHSKVAANLAGINLLNYWKYTDTNGIERKLRIADINGILTIINDGVPYKKATTAVTGVYTVKVGGTLAEGDKITIAGVETTLTSSSAASAGAAATAIAAGSYSKYTATASGDTVTFTEKSGNEGTGVPAASADSDAITLEVKTTTAGVAASNAEYTTYLLGLGSILHSEAPVKVPVEVTREALKNGGEDILVTRIREAYHPNGFTFSKPGAYTASPTNSDLGNSSNWAIAASDVRAIPMVKIVSNG